MLLILEGPDCGGKSTLADRLQLALKRAYPLAATELWHRGPPTAHPLDEYGTPLHDYRPGRGRHVICDRWHVGESVYPAVVDRPSALDDAVRTHLELLLRSRGALVLHCTASVAALEACLEVRGDAVVRRDQAAALRAGFLAAEAASLLPTVRVHATDVDESRVVDLLTDAVLLDRFAARLNPFVTYVGPPTPRLLLLGDRRGRSDVPLTDLDDEPAFVPRGATSGHYLLRALATHAPAALPDLGVANACDVDDPTALWEALGRPETVALGWAASQRVPFATRVAPHPQYWRRFRHHDAAEYVREIIGA